MTTTGSRTIRLYNVGIILQRLANGGAADGRDSSEASGKGLPQLVQRATTSLQTGSAIIGRWHNATDLQWGARLFGTPQAVITK